MNNIAQKTICLCLNRNWEPIGYKSVKDTIIQLCSGAGEDASLALDIDYELMENGEPDISTPRSITPVKWEDWIKLPVRSWELSINSSTMSIRVPTVVVAMNYNKMPVKMFRGKPTKDGVWKRDGGVCQYTGRALSKDEANIDHVIPKSKGGADSWTNMVLSCKDINTKKGNRLNGEIGLRLIKEPKAPTPTRMCDLITDIKHVDWRHFVKN